MKLHPNHIEVLLHYLVSPEKHPRVNAPAVQGAINFFLGEEIFEIRTGVDAASRDSDSSYRVTERGRAFVGMLCETPLPVASWTDPRK